MAKLTTRIAIPIILAGIFAIVVFVAIGYGQLTDSFYVVVLTLVIFVFIFGFAIGYTFSSPFKEILRKAEELDEGNLSSRIYLNSKDEFSELARIFNKLAEDAEVNHEQKIDMEKSVGAKVQAKTKELEEMVRALERKVRDRTTELERMVRAADNFQEAAKKGKGKKIRPRIKV